MYAAEKAEFNKFLINKRSKYSSKQRKFIPIRVIIHVKRTTNITAQYLVLKQSFEFPIIVTFRISKCTLKDHFCSIQMFLNK